MKELAYICQEIKSPLNGIRFTKSLLEATDLTENQKQYLETSAACDLCCSDPPKMQPEFNLNKTEVKRSILEQN
ncbi:hypothetical protein RND71_040413 [Anisodus tanguticus]|uniref:Signal transduction histidine kinase dimerisation/phosphoacceptor domain-containing protein n=1 Tax=Anisodus tanguticus TaxID=243964 RepID=A0AAE1UTA9_9SOLA|nr:hypothetical protein RND71_040413 [Anisodus tanguticus]